MEKKNFGDRRPSSSSRSESPKKSFGGDRKPYNKDERPPRTFGDKPAFGGDRKPFDKDNRAPRSFGDKPAFGDRKPFDKDSRPARNFGDKPSFGDRKPFDRDSRPARNFGDKPSFGDRKPFDRDSRPPRDFGDKPSYGDRKPFDRDSRPPRDFGDKPAFGDRKPFDRDSRPARNFGDKPSYGDRKPFDRDSRPARDFGDKPSYGDRKPFDRDSRPPRDFGDKPSYGDRKPFDRDSRPARNFGDKPSYSDRKPFDRDSRPPRDFGDKPAFGDRKPFDRDSRPSRDFSDRKPFDRGEKPFNREEREPRFGRSMNDDSTEKPFSATKEFGSSDAENTAPRERKVFKKEFGSTHFEEKKNDEQRIEKSLDRMAKISSENPRFKKSSFERDRFDDVEKGKDKNPDEMRLNRFISHAGVCSRRDADELIRKEQVKVNGKVVTEMGYQVKMTDEVKLNGKILTPERFVYVLLNKPKDYLTTTEDPNERRTVMDLVAGATNLRIYPVGRLDRNTTGLLLLTNDGSLADKLTHPSHEIRKVYQAELDKKISEEHVQALIDGIELEDGKIKADDVSIITPDAEVVGIEIHSGRNRIVRRMFEHLGYEVTKLDRTMFGPLTKKELPRGEWRYLSEREIVRLKSLK